MNFEGLNARVKHEDDVHRCPVTVSSVANLGVTELLVAANTVLPTTTATMVQVKHDEHEYLNLIRDILDSGESRADRTGTGTLSLFAPPQPPLLPG